jgi:GntR family transcriptional regulator/MocR family aminotransferase
MEPTQLLQASMKEDRRVRIPLQHQGSVPLYRQIEDYLRQNILAGTIAPGTRLPPTRQLAEDLGVSRITVKNAYAALESDGLIVSREGSGTYVTPPAPVPADPKSGEAAPWPLWQQAHAAPDKGWMHEPVQPRQSSQDSPLISFRGVGDPRHFPVTDFFKAMKTVLRRDGVAALEYGEFDSGYARLRATVTHVLGSQGIRAQPDNVLITSGSQQALALVCQILLKPGDVVVVEKPTYNLALELFHALELKVVGVPVDAYGMRVEALEPLLQQHHPRLIYTIPNFQNPTGVCLSGPRRRELLALADRYNIPVLEDDFAGDLRFDGRTLPAVKALDPGGRVIYTGTFSKMLMPGLRVGYLLAEGPVFDRLVSHKRVNDLTTSTLMQRTLDRYVTVGRYQTHLRRSSRIYRQRRDAMLAAIRHHLPQGVSVIPPQGGLFMWLRLPEPLSSLRLLPLALEEGVEFAPGSIFFPEPAEGKPYLRLNFATQPPEAIEEGVQRLTRALERLTR